MSETVVVLDAAQHATVLAALRYYQSRGMGDPANRPAWIHDLAINGGEIDAGLDEEGIDELCEHVNAAPDASLAPPVGAPSGPDRIASRRIAGLD